MSNKMINYLVVGTDKATGKEYCYDAKAPNQTELKKNFAANNIKVNAVKRADQAHFCKYCGGIADGTYEDLLCEDCRMMFGHSLYSEL